MSPTFSVDEFYSGTCKIQIKVQLWNILEQLFRERLSLVNTSQFSCHVWKRQESATKIRTKCKKINCTINHSTDLCQTMIDSGKSNRKAAARVPDNDNEVNFQELQATFGSPTDLRLHNSLVIDPVDCVTTNNFSDSYLSTYDFTSCSCQNSRRPWKSRDNSHDKKRRMTNTSKSSWTYYFCVVLISVFLINSFLINSVEACGPGRGVGRRRAPRKLTPLVYKQHVPNIPEHHTPASGNSEGPIRPNDQKRFKELVPNYNTDIIFRDDEGTGADRLMNLRCKDKLNTLAISVMNQWPGVKLRVIEGWDNTTGPLATGNSLHYEGRAVDIQTSDRDKSKYGMLARLAVEAGFDWVYYESRSYIHCSVKSDSSQGGRTGGCFSGNSTVQTRFRGVQLISSVVPNDELLTVDSYGQLSYSPVLLFLDRNQTEMREFLQITTESGRQLMITPSHLLYTFPDQIQPNYYDKLFLNVSMSGGRTQAEVQQMMMSFATVTFARKVEIGDWLLLVQNKNVTDSEISFNSNSGAAVSGDQSGSLVLERVVDIQVKEETGVYAPLTATGTIVVDNVVSSCYAVVESQSLAHWSFFPIRLLHNFSKGLSQLWKQFNFLITLSSARPGQKGQAVFVNMVQTRIKSHENQVKTLNANNQGIHWYASMLYSLTSQLLPSYYLYGS